MAKDKKGAGDNPRFRSTEEVRRAYAHPVSQIEKAMRPADPVRTGVAIAYDVLRPFRRRVRESLQRQAE